METFNCILIENDSKMSYIFDNEVNGERLIDATKHLKSNLNQIETKIKDFAKLNFHILKPDVDHSEDIIKQIDLLFSQLQKIRSDLEENEKLLKNVSEIDEFKNLIEKIEMINKVIGVIDFLQKYDETIEEFSIAIDRKDYAKCNLLFLKLANFKNTSSVPLTKFNQTNKNVNLLLEDEAYSDLNKIIAYRELRSEFTVQRERLWYEINIEWDKLLQINLDPASNNIYISINNNVDQEYLNQLTKYSKYKTNSTLTGTLSFVFITKMKQFCKKFLEFCQSNIIAKQCNLEDTFEIVNDPKSKNVKLQLKNHKGSNSSTQMNPAVQLDIKLDLILKVLKFLNDNLFKLTVYINKSECESEVEVSLMSIFSELILNDFVKIIYQELIISIIPLKNYDCKLETSICQLVNKFEEDLRTISFLSNEKLSNLSNKVKCQKDSEFNLFVSNVEELYIRKKCKFIMEKSRGQMKQQEFIFDMVKINEKDSDLKVLHEIVQNFNLKSESSKAAQILDELIHIKESNKNKSILDDIGLLQLPDCAISKTAKLTAELVYETLNEAFRMVQSSQEREIKNISLLCLIARNIFDLYINVIPTYHLERFKSIPLLSAIGYNDFIYLAFNCLTITHQYKYMFLNINKNNKLTDKMRPLDRTDYDEIVQNFSCLDLIPKLCMIGSDILNKQIDSQQELLMQFLHEDCNGIIDLSDGNNYELLTKALQKCNVQLNNLASAWFNVLPLRVYFRVFGRFYNFICNDLLKSCLKLEDISSDDASYLFDAFSIVKQSVYEIFSKYQSSILKSNENESILCTENLTINTNIADLNASRYIKMWPKFNHLLFILKANLQEIVDAWCDSKGLLALHFDSEEVRHLVRALFMITDKRSHALDQIK